MLSVLLNPLNASTTFLKDSMQYLSGRIRPPAEEEIDAAERRKILGWDHKAGVDMVREILTDCILRAERRLNRDVTRVFEYYETLSEEIDRHSRKKAARGEGAGILAEDVTAEVKLDPFASYGFRRQPRNRRKAGTPQTPRILSSPVPQAYSPVSELQWTKKPGNS
jgi:hypothetical protein